MPKLSKQAVKKHEAALVALERIKDEPRNINLREQVLRDYRADYDHNITWNNAFFTPPELAHEMMIECAGNGRVLDLCAGIGGLALAYGLRFANHIGKLSQLDITCVERSQSFVDIGRKLLPEARWIVGDIRDPDLLKGERFDEVISNPPFGAVHERQKHESKHMEFIAAETAMRLSDRGTFIVPHSVLSWRMNAQRFERFENAKYESWSQRTGLAFEANCGICVDHIKFAQTNIRVEIANLERV